LIRRKAVWPAQERTVRRGKARGSCGSGQNGEGRRVESAEASEQARRASAEAPVDWLVSEGPVAYEQALAVMEGRAAAIAAGTAAELVWLLEHPPLYTAGTSARREDLLAPDRFPVHVAGRGGQYTYHGPGQRIAYVMLDVRRRGGDVRRFVGALEGWLIDTLAQFGVRGEMRPGRVGVWVRRPEKGPGAEDKIAAIGIRIRRWVSLHGVSLNVEPDLEHFSGIVPCGISGHGVTSLADLGRIVVMPEVDMALAAAFVQRFGPVRRVGSVPELLAG
jgi:lipoyl(octanoyl) transferase